MITLQEVQQAYREAYVANADADLKEIRAAIMAAASKGLPNVAVISSKLNSEMVKVLVQQGFKIIHERATEISYISWI